MKRRRKPRAVEAHCTRSARLDSSAWPSRSRSNSKLCNFIQPLTELTRICRRRLRQKQKVKSKTVDELSEMTKARRSLSKRVRELQGCQRVYIPGVADLLDASQEDERLEDQPEVLKLWLPSQLSDDDRSAWCLPGISHLEFRFRYVQASDTLTELRRLRQLFQGTRDQNAKHTKSTSSTTRSQGILDGFHSRTKRVANRYRSARQALLALDPEEKLVTGWKRYFLELKEGDIRGPDRETDEDSEGRFQQSWIWTVSYPQPNSSNSSSSDLEDVDFVCLAFWSRVPWNNCRRRRSSARVSLACAYRNRNSK